MKNAKLVLVFAVSLIGGFLIFSNPHTAKALSPYDQTNGTALDTNDGGPESGYFSINGLPTSYNITSITIYATGMCYNDPTYFANTRGMLYDSSFGLLYDTGQFARPTGSGTSPQALTYNFGSGITGLSNYVFYFEFDGTSCSSGSHQLRILSNGTGDATYVKKLNSGWSFRGAPQTYLNGAGLPWQIAFNNGFSDGMSTPDFSVWQVLLTFPDGMYNPGWQVEYKAASSTYYTWFDNEFLTGYANGNFTALEHSMRKKTPLTPGNYIAKAIVYSNGNPLGVSDDLHFTITNAAPILTPGVDPVPTSTTYSFASTSTPSLLYNDSGCVDTSFAVLGADFGKGICQVFAFLFVPGQAALNQFSDTQNLISNKAPFSYLYEIGNDLTNLNPTAATMTPLTLTIGSTSSPIHLSVDIFSADTIERYTSSTARSVLRTLIQWSLYLAFLAMIILEVRHLFSKDEPKQ